MDSKHIKFSCLMHEQELAYRGSLEDHEEYAMYITSLFLFFKKRMNEFGQVLHDKRREGKVDGNLG